MTESENPNKSKEITLHCENSILVFLQEYFADPGEERLEWRLILFVE